MQWDASAHGGFSTVETWLPLAEDYRTVNVEAEQADPHSMLTLYKHVIELRRSDEALTLGDYLAIDTPKGVFAYVRGGKYTIALNFTDEIQHLNFGGEILISTHGDRRGPVITLELRPNEGVILRP